MTLDAPTFAGPGRGVSNAALRQLHWVSKQRRHVDAAPPGMADARHSVPNYTISPNLHPP